MSGLPSGVQLISTPDEEFAYNNKVFIDRAARNGLDYVSLVWRPWSLQIFDPEMKMLEMTFEHVREHGLTPTTFAGLHAELKGRL